MFKTKFLIVSVLLISLLSACAGSATQTPAPTQPISTAVPTTAATQAPASTEMPTQATTQTPAIPSTGGIDWTQYGFPTVLASQQFTPGTAITINASPYTIQVPADAFTETVTIQVLSGDPANFMAKAPAGEQPVLAFAINVTNQQGQFVEKFNKPVTLTASSANIVADSKYYNIAVDGTYSPNPTGLQVSAGQLSHPIAGTPVAWVITSPAAASSSPTATMSDTLNISNNSTLGNILVNDQGMTLYTFKNDTSGVSNCTGSCAAIWPPLTVASGVTPTAASGITGTLGVITRADGSQQVTYNGMPLYTYSGDTKPGDTNGQGFKQLWYVVSATGTSGSSSSKSTGGRGGGY